MSVYTLRWSFCITLYSYWFLWCNIINIPSISSTTEERLSTLCIVWDLNDDDLGLTGGGINWTGSGWGSTAFVSTDGFGLTFGGLGLTGSGTGDVSASDSIEGVWTGGDWGWIDGDCSSAAADVICALATHSDTKVLADYATLYGSFTIIINTFFIILIS